MTKKFLPQNQIVQSTVSAQTTQIAVPQNWPVHTTTAANVVNVSTSFDFSAETTALLMTLIDSEFDFILGGSRAMYKRGAQVNIVRETDYDFYATYTIEIEDFLSKHGFWRDDKSIGYCDDEVVAIYKAQHVDVVLRKDAKFYKSVFDKIDAQMYVKYLWKRNPACDRSKITLLFNEMFKTVRNTAPALPNVVDEEKIRTLHTLSNGYSDEDDEDLYNDAFTTYKNLRNVRSPGANPWIST